MSNEDKSSWVDRYLSNRLSMNTFSNSLSKYRESSKRSSIPLSEQEHKDHIPASTSSYTQDTVVNSVIHQLIERSRMGLIKYGTTLDRNDLELLDWIEHSKQEAMDFVLYLEKMKRVLLNTAAASVPLPAAAAAAAVPAVDVPVPANVDHKDDNKV